MNSLDLYFTSSPDLQLAKTCFYFNFNAPIVTVRGKNYPHSGQTGNFIWSSGVRSLTYLLLQSVCLAQMGTKNVYILAGKKGSLAHSLALTLMKEPNWLAEMFGTDIKGKARARRLINIRNQYYNLGDEVELSINTEFLKLTEVSFYLNNHKQTSLRGLVQMREALNLTLLESGKSATCPASEAQLHFDF